jgi:putative toxin-antitoxin system antitoxin component (TIGR02293 family)
MSFPRANLAKLGGCLLAIRDSAERIARVSAEAIELIGDAAKAAHWLRTPNRYLGGKTPSEMLETETGTQAVEQSLYAIACGGVG